MNETIKIEEKLDGIKSELEILNSNLQYLMGLVVAGNTPIDGEESAEDMSARGYEISKGL